VLLSCAELFIYFVLIDSSLGWWAESLPLLLCSVDVVVFFYRANRFHTAYIRSRRH